MKAPALAVLLAAAGAVPRPAGAGDRELVDRIRALQALPQAPVSRPPDPGRKPYFVPLRRLVCAASGATDEDLAADLKDAQEALAACGVEIRALPPVPFPSDYGPDQPCRLSHGEHLRTLPPDQRALFKRRHRPELGLTVFYLAFRSGPDARVTDGSSVAADLIRRLKEDNAFDRGLVGAMVVFQRARRLTPNAHVLAHEMGHVLIDNADHSYEKGNLMEEFAEGRELTAGQCARIRASPFVRRE